MHCRVEETDTPFTRGCSRADVLALPIKHGEGCYVADAHTLQELEDNRQIVLRYVDSAGRTTEAANPNGSLQQHRRHRQREAQRLRTDAAPRACLRSALRRRRRRQSLPLGPRHSDRGAADARGVGAARAMTTTLPPVTRSAGRSSTGSAPRSSASSCDAIGRGAQPRRARRLLGDVVGALQLQELARGAARAADDRTARPAGARARTPARSAIGDGPRGGVQDREPQPSVVHRAVSGRRHRRRRHPARRVHDGRAPDRQPQLAALRQLRPSAHPLPDRRRRRAASAATATASACRRSAARSISIPRYNENILVNAFTIGLVRADRIFRASAAGVGNPVIYVGSKTGRDGIHGASLLASGRVRRDQ